MDNNQEPIKNPDIGASWVAPTANVPCPTCGTCPTCGWGSFLQNWVYPYWQLNNYPITGCSTSGTDINRGEIK